MAQLNYITSRMNTKRLLWNINGLEPKKKKRCRRKNITVMGVLFKRALLVRRLITKLLLAIQYMNQRWRQRHDWETLIVLSLVHFFLFLFLSLFNCKIISFNTLFDVYVFFLLESKVLLLQWSILAWCSCIFYHLNVKVYEMAYGIMYELWTTIKIAFILRCLTQLIELIEFTSIL